MTLADIDLSEASHDKNMDSVKASFTNDYYKYILADYGGQTDVENKSYNIDHLPPAISEEYIFRRIFKAIGMSYNLPIPIDTWLTYPKATDADLGYEAPTVLSESKGSGQLTTNVINGGAFFEYVRLMYNEIAPNVQIELETGKGQPFPTYAYLTNFEEGYYNINMSADVAEATYRLRHNASPGIQKGRKHPVKMYVNVSGQRYLNGVSTGTIKLTPSDKVIFEFRALSTQEIRDKEGQDWHVGDVSYLNLKNFKGTIQKHIFQEIDFGGALFNIKATDFIKYIMHRYGLTLFYKDNAVKFMTIAERLEAEEVDYSEMFKERTSESYTYSGYAQKNILAHKYVSDDVGYNDGVIHVDNKNLDEQKTLLESFTFTPTRDGQLTLFNKEIKEDNNKNITVGYKSIDRNFSIKIKSANMTVELYSNIQQVDKEAYHGIKPIAEIQGTTFKEYKNLYYGGVERILNRTKIHKATFRMSVYQFLHVDLSKRLYLRQEASSYLINSISLKVEQEVEMNLIKLD